MKKTTVKPAKMIPTKNASSKASTISNISTVLQQQNEALNVLQSNAISTQGSKDYGAKSADHVQVILKLDQILRAIRDGSEITKKQLNVVETQKMSVMATEFALKKTLSLFSSIGKGVTSIFTGSASSSKMKGKDYKSAQEEKFSASDSRKHQKDPILEKLKSSSFLTAPKVEKPKQQGIPQTTIPQQTSQGSGKSAKDMANVMGGNTAAISAPLVLTPSDKGKIAQSTTDVLAEKQVADAQAVEKTKTNKIKVNLLQQIANNTGIMSGRKSSAAGGKEDIAGATIQSETSGKLGGGIGTRAAHSLVRSLGSFGGSVSGVRKNIGGNFSNELKLIHDGFKMLSSRDLILGMRNFSYAGDRIKNTLRLLVTPFKRIIPLLTKFSSVAGKTFVSGLESLVPILKSVAGVVTKLGEGMVTVFSKIVTGVSDLAKIIMSWVAGDKYDADKNASTSGQKAANAIVNAVSGSSGKEKKQTDAQNDQLEQQAGVRYDQFGNMTVVDKKKYDQYIKARGGKMPESGISGKGRWTTAAVPSPASQRKEGSILDNATKEIRETKRKREEMMAKRSGGTGSVVNAPQTTNNSSIQTNYRSVRNQESSVSKYHSARYL